MSKIKNGGLDQYGKFYPLTGSAVKGLNWILASVKQLARKIIFEVTYSVSSGT